jgi:hypothetical protein
MEPVVLQAVRRSRLFSLLPADYLVLDGQLQAPVRMLRILPANYGGVLDLYERGILQEITPLPRLSEFLALHRQPAGPSDLSVPLRHLLKVLR